MVFYFEKFNFFVMLDQYELIQLLNVQSESVRIEINFASLRQRDVIHVNTRNFWLIIPISILFGGLSSLKFLILMLLFSFHSTLIQTCLTWVHVKRPKRKEMKRRKKVYNNKQINDDWIRPHKDMNLLWSEASVSRNEKISPVTHKHYCPKIDSIIIYMNFFDCPFNQDVENSS